ncbi:DUF1264-domain-containing protein [Trametopsis cervina]|nr:DUF1264-domain-containing protein [Trametopsis cervina]
MEFEAKRETYHSPAYMAAGAAMMSFAPINRIHQHICAFHVYSDDPSRVVKAYHFCTHRSADFHQCIIFDSAEPDARLIGIEYIVTEKIFESLPEDEKKYWHGHKYEIESGLLQIMPKKGIPAAVVDAAEKPAMLELQSTYGKTIHTWPYDINPDLPLGPPNLMMSYTNDSMGPPPELLEARDAESGQRTETKRQLRAEYLPPYEKSKGADQWATTGKGISFVPTERDLK